MKHIIVLLLVGTILLSCQPSAAFAYSYSPNTIISDHDYFDTSSMTVDEVQKFLERKGSFLAHYATSDADGSTRTAAQVIHRAAVAYGISPKVMLVLLQKEQSLIENPSPTQYALDWATGYAICDSCSPADPRLAGYKGFVNQVEQAASRKQYYTLSPQSFTFRPNETKLVDGLPVTPSNAATAALYNYTPHLRGNYSFWRLWNRYFSKLLPDGMVVQATGSNTIWLIQQGKRRPFSSVGAFLSRYSMSQIVSVSPGDLGNYLDGSPIRYPQYSLLRSPKGAIFLLVDDKKYGITSKQVFKNIGFNPDEVVAASDKDLGEIPTGGLISTANANPMGELVQDAKTGGVFYVKDSVKYPIVDRAVLNINFPYRKITKMASDKLNAIKRGEPVKLAEGSLVKLRDSDTVYVISNGQKRQILSRDTFDSLGFNEDNLREVSPASLALSPDGLPLDIGQNVGEEDPNLPPPIFTSASLQP